MNCQVLKFLIFLDNIFKYHLVWYRHLRFWRKNPSRNNCGTGPFTVHTQIHNQNIRTTPYTTICRRLKQEDLTKSVWNKEQIKGQLGLLSLILLQNCNENKTSWVYISVVEYLLSMFKASCRSSFFFKRSTNNRNCFTIYRNNHPEFND